MASQFGGVAVNQIEQPKTSSKFGGVPVAPHEDGGMFDAFVKGLKTFTAPFGAGSVTTPEQEQATVDRIRNSPGEYLLDQIPFFRQFQGVRDQLKAGRDKGNVAAETVGQLVAGAASAPPIPMGKSPTPSQALSRYGGEFDPPPAPAAPPKSSAVLDLGKGIAKRYAAHKLRGLKDLVDTGMDIKDAYDLIVGNPPESPALPPVASAPAVQQVSPALNSLAVKAGFSDFASAPEQIKPLLENAHAAELDRLAQPPVSPKAAPAAPGEVSAPVQQAPAAAQTPAAMTAAEQLREMLAPGSASGEVATIAPEVPEVTPKGKAAIGKMMRDLGPGAPKAVADAAYAGDQTPATARATYEAAGRATKSQALSQMLRDEGITAARAAKWTPEEWAKAADDRGFSAKHDPFSEASQKETLTMLRKLEKTKAVTMGDLMKKAETK